VQGWIAIGGLKAIIERLDGVLDRDLVLIKQIEC